MKVLHILLGSLILLIASSCASQKSKTAQEYKMMDNLTSRFNIVYHANKIIDETESNLRKSHVNDFNRYLPVFIEPSELNESDAAYLMDSVIGKANRIIDEKSSGRFVNQAYLLLGQANYLKGNFYNAAEFFNYLAQNYKEFPEYHQIGRIMQARALTQLGRLDEAADALDSAFANLETHKKTQGLAFAAQAAYYLQIKDVENAASMLEQALAQKGNRLDKSRWGFLLGQLYLDLNNADKAYYWFRKLSKNGQHEMGFQAKLNSIRLESIVNPDFEKTIKSFKKLLRDDKNKDFKDQIQYLMAQTYIEQGESDLALSHLEKSIRESTSNRVQTAKSFGSLGDLFFAKSDFHQANLYYDSAALAIPNHYPGLEAFQKKLLNYQQIAKSRSTIQHQDSLIYLANLPEEERQEIVNKKIADIYAQMQKETKRKNRGKESLRSNLSISPFDQLSSLGNVNQRGNNQTDNRFYFSNPDAMGLGEVAFRKKWGNRSLQDNWRFGTTNSDQNLENGMGTGLAEEQNSEYANTSEELLDEKTFADRYWEKLRTELPVSLEKQIELRASNQIELEQIGNIYRFNLDDSKQAISIYEELLERFPNSNEKSRWYYQLFQLYEPTDLAKSNAFKTKILSEFPESVFAAVIKDPNFFKSTAAQKKEITNAFNNVFTLFESLDYPGVQKAVDQIVSQMSPAQIKENESLVAQLAYLRALSMGYEQPISIFIEHLQGIQEKFPSEKLITPLVQQQIAYIQENADEFDSREIALLNPDFMDSSLKSGIAMTPWPQLILKTKRELAIVPPPRDPIHIHTQSAGTSNTNKLNTVATQVQQQNIINSAPVIDLRNESAMDRDLTLLPEEGTYFFVINVMHGSVNLAPSRFGIGQFNRSRFAQAKISHQLKNVKQENQLIYIGAFSSYSEAKSYEIQILPLLMDIMKIPSEAYASFIATEQTLNSFTDGDTVFQYQELYNRQR